MAKLKNKHGSNLLLEHAFKQLHAPLYFYALKFVNSSDVAKDLVQDAFLSMLNLREETEIENLNAYLFRTVRNNCLDFIKHVEVKSKFTEKEKERAKREIIYYDIHKTLVEKELHQKLYETIEELPEQYKIPFKLSRFEELKAKEISNQLKLPVRTVETQIYRALKLLREKFQNQGLILFSIYFQKNK